MNAHPHPLVPATPIGAASPEVGTRPEGRARHVPSTFSRIARVAGEASAAGHGRRHPNRPIPELAADQLKRFWSRVDQTGDCWTWAGHADQHGRGFISFNGKQYRAARVMWAIANGDCPDLDVCHRCDNPRCLNPAHLFVGTHAENMRDMAAKGRSSPPPRKTHCIRGHLLAGENVRDRGKAGRECRACAKQREERRAELRRASGQKARGFRIPEDQKLERYLPNSSRRIARVAGEYFDADQISWSCEDCGRDEYCCDCEDEPTCQCGDPLDEHNYCKSCEDYWPSGWEMAERSAIYMGGAK